MKINGSILVLCLIIQILGFIVFGIGTMAFVGYVIDDQKFYRWIGDIGMAFNTSLCFVAIGVALMLIAPLIYERRKNGI